MDKAVGKAKEACGALTGDEALKAEGRRRAAQGGVRGGSQAEGEDEAGEGRGQASGEGAR
jgi:uncharacterized protein YjbJ (UPF0337 family)